MEIAPLNTGLETLSEAIAIANNIPKEDAKKLVNIYFKSLSLLLRESKESFKIPFSLGVLYTRKGVLNLTKTTLTKNYIYDDIYNLVR